MPIDPKEGLYEHAGFKGLRNNVPSDRFELEDLEAAQNVDIDDSGRISRRKGHGAAVVSGSCKSLWSDGLTALVVRDETTLVQILPSYSVTTLRTGLTPGLAMSFDGLGHRIYYSNSAETGVVEDGRSRSWGLAVPQQQPVATVVGGVLPIGRYQFAVTFLRSDGQESGSLRAGLIELLSPGGIQLADLPVSSDPDVTRKVVYFSKCNGETLYRAGVVPVADTTFNYLLEASMQVPLSTQHLRPAPAGQYVGGFSGRMLVAVGDALYYSEPYAPELFDLRKNFRFPGPITMLAPLDSGVYVGTDVEVVWLAGTVPEKWTRAPRLSYGAIPGAVTRCSRDVVDNTPSTQRVAIVATTQGICIGDDSGTIVNVTRERFVYPVQARGATVVRQHRGMSQCLVSMQGAEQAGNVSS